MLGLPYLLPKYFLPIDTDASPQEAEANLTGLTTQNLVELCIAGI